MTPEQLGRCAIHRRGPKRQNMCVLLGKWLYLSGLVQTFVL